jgi:pilus assembly protein CpaC
MIFKTARFVAMFLCFCLFCSNNVFAAASSSSKANIKTIEEELSGDAYNERFSQSNISHLENSSPAKQVMLRVKIGEVNKQIASSLFMSSEKDMLRIFAEPTLVALSGTSAFFQSGGEFPVVSAQGIEFKSYGLKISFTPVVISGSRIKMEVYSEISELSKDIFIKSNSSMVPVIESRKAKTTVELAPGQSFMIAGLVKDIVNKNTRDNTELVVSVTPYIVHPMSSGAIRLPTDKYYRHNNMEIKFIDNLNKNAGVSSGSEYKLEGPAGLIAE